MGNIIHPDALRSVMENEDNVARDFSRVVPHGCGAL